MKRRTSGLLALGWAAVGLVWYSLYITDPDHPTLAAVLWVVSCGFAGSHLAGFVQGGEE